MDVVIITPEPGRAKEIGQRLLAMAENPRDVQWVTWPVAGFSVPLELFGHFEATDGADGEYVKWVPKQDLAAGTTIEPGHIDADEETPAKRRRGRPRKQEETSTDDTTTSPEEE